MSLQLHTLAAGRVQHGGAPPWRDVVASLAAPIGDGLKREPCGASNIAGAIKSCEDVVDHLHFPGISDDRITLQAGIYPKLADARPSRVRHNIGMSDSAFDPALVRRSMKEQKITQTQMAQVMGLPSQSAFSNILNGGRRVTAQEAQTAYRFLGLSTGNNLIELHSVPIIGYSSAGVWREAVEVPLGYLPIPPKMAGRKAFAVQVDGDSLDKVIADGSYVVVDPDQKELIAGKFYLLQNGDHEVTLKCYQRNPARFVPMSTNPDHVEFLVSEHDFVILGRVVWRGSPM